MTTAVQPPLSPRERQCVALLCEDMSNAEVAEVMGVSVHTVDAFLVHIREAFTLAGAITQRWVVSFMDWRHVSALERCPPAGLRFVRFGIWYKPNGAPQFTGDRPATGWEAIVYLHKEGGRMRWNGGGRHGVYAESKVNGEHPTTKPLVLVERLVKDFTDPGETILDPFMGSGTTLVAAKMLGRKAIGIELEQKWADVAVRRIKATEYKPSLFDYPAITGKQMNAVL